MRDINLYLLVALLAIVAHVNAFRPRRYSTISHNVHSIRGGDSSSIVDNDNTNQDTSTSTTSQDDSRTMYNKQATNWVRTEPRCLSDFTGRPVVFGMLADELQTDNNGNSNKVVLDVGCGEGYCARKVIELGASKVVGCDISQEMISSAQTTSEGDGRFTYYASPVGELLQSLKEQGESTQFDIAIAVFLFNYLTTTDMEDAIMQIYQALKPGGVFVFSVPHPSMIFCHDKASVFNLDSEGRGYYTSRNEKIYGQISTIDGTKLNIMSVHKTLGDYITAINKAGFHIDDIQEAGVTEEHMKLHPDFFESVNDRPLHLVFKLRKP